MSDEKTRKILALTVEAPMTVKQMSQATGIPPGTLYHRVNDLKSSALLFGERAELSARGKKTEFLRATITHYHLRMDENMQFELEIIPNPSLTKRIWLSSFDVV